MDSLMLILLGAWLILVGFAAASANFYGRKRWPDGYVHNWVVVLFLSVGGSVLALGLAQ